MEKIVVLGAGESGVGAAVLAKKNGFEVFVSDFSAIKDNYKQILKENSIPFEEGGHTAEKILQAKEIIKSPGIKENAPIVEKAREKNIPIISEIEFAFKFLPKNAKTICVTGSNGKTTTTELIYSMLKKMGKLSEMCGNIGKSFAMTLSESSKAEYYVLELSSFQLDGMYDFRADVAILLNITPDHLDRYDWKLENYAASKFRITQNQNISDAFIYFSDDKNIEKEMKKHTLKQKLYPFNLSSDILKNFADCKLKGIDNFLNITAALLAIKHLGLDLNLATKAAEEFSPVEHRIEPSGMINGVEYINDSKATNVDAVWYALEAIKTKVVLILGGVDKGNDYSQLYPFLKEKVTAIVAMGKDNSLIHKAFDNRIEVFDTSSMDSCLEMCIKIAKPGETVLLSPACASFDLFTCYEDRGEQFKAGVSKRMK